MSAELRYSLMVHITRVEGREKPHATIQVQCWKGDVCLTTIRIAEHQEFDWPAELPLQTAENFATVNLRIAARIAEEVLFERLSVGGLNTTHDILREFGSVGTV